MKYPYWTCVRKPVAFACLVVTMLFLSLANRSYAFAGATQTITLYAYNSDGTNTGTARLGGTVTFKTYVQNATNTAVTWSVSGAGSISTSGIYTAPNTMPSSTSVTVKATLVENTAVTASYTFTLINPIPTIYSANNYPLTTAATDTVTLNGAGFVAGTKILVNGTAVTATYQSITSMSVQIPVSGTASGSVSVVAVNPTPGGGTSSAYSIPIATPTIVLNAYNGDGQNTGTARLGSGLTAVPTIHGTGNTSVTWSVSGAGSIDSTGKYTSPTAMPSNASVTVTGTLVSNPAISASYTFTLINPVPVLYSVNPNPLTTATTDTVTISGTGFVSGTVIKVNGSAVTSAFSSFTKMTAQIPVSGTASGTLSITAVNPTPGGGTSNAVSATIATPTIKLNAYNSDGTNTGTARLGAAVTVVPTVTGTANTSVTYSLSGAGSIDTTGRYTCPTVMPSNSTVTVTATLVSNTAISASYTFTLINPVPVVSSTNPTAIKTNTTTNVYVQGQNFVTNSQVYVNGTAVATTYVSFGKVSVPITVADNFTAASVVITATNPTPGGGTSTSFSLPVTPKTIQLSGYSDAGVNPTTLTLGLSMQFYVAITNGTGDNTATFTVTGGGSISSSGRYTAPTSMPSSSTVTITAALVSNPAVTTTYTFSLQNPVPVIDGTTPTQLSPGVANTVTIQGSGFVSGTSILVNGTAAATTFKSDSAVQVQITPSSTATSVTIAAANPAPSGGTSSSFTIPVGTAKTVTATVGTTTGYTIPLNFLGLSHEWVDAEWSMGWNSHGVNYVYRQLIKNLMNGASYPFVIRIGGASTDSSTEPDATTTPAFTDLYNAMGTVFDLGVNLGADNVTLAADQAKAFVSQMPAGALNAIEIGNEPENYGLLGLRASTYGFTDYQSDFATWRQNVLPLLPSGTKLMGPAWANMVSLSNLSTFESPESSNLSVVSEHHYAGHQSTTTSFPTNFLLLASTATQGPKAVAPYVPVAHKYGQKFRIGEMNSIDGGGVTGISDSFSSALWAVDIMFEFANVGVDGVNWHGMSGCTYCAFTFGKATVGSNSVYTLTQVNPLYYGMLFFQKAAGNNSKLLPVTLGSTTANIKVWATVDQSGIAHVAILNKDTSFSGNVQVTLAGYSSASVTRLQAPSYTSNSGISIGGQTFDGSLDGTLVGSADNETITPSNNVFTVPVQPTSAVLLTVTP